MDTERIRQLMMAAIDDEISESENRELDAALASEPALRMEMRRMADLQKQISGIVLKDPADDVLSELDATLTKRAGLPLGWVMLLVGVLIVFVWSAMSWLRDPSLPAVLRWGGVLAFAGLLLLLCVKLRERCIERRVDPYRDVIR